MQEATDRKVGGGWRVGQGSRRGRLVSCYLGCMADDGRFQWVADAARFLFSQRAAQVRIAVAGFIGLATAIGFRRKGVVFALFCGVLALVTVFTGIGAVMERRHAKNARKPEVRFASLKKDMVRIWRNQNAHLYQRMNMSLVEDKVAYELERLGIAWNADHVRELIDLAQRRALQKARRTYPL